MHLRHLMPFFAFAVGISALPNTASASPGFNFACFGGVYSSNIGLDEAWEVAYVKNSDGETELKSIGPRREAGNNSFDFSDGTTKFSGILPEGQITRNGETIARCWQTAESIRAIALYDTGGQGNWSNYNVEGQGFQTVRKTPSVFGERLASLESGSPVTILENTDQFLDGFYWFKIKYGAERVGYIWGALLCTDAENLELNATVRRCTSQ